MKSKIILLVLVFIFVIHSLHLDFTQDDAFISFRYIKNFLSGYGLVFNPGERVEGYTNFFWIIFLSILVKSGLDVIFLSKILGILSGAGVIILLYFISLRYVERKYWYFALFPSAFLVANSSFSYWSISGLETSFFAFGVLLSVWSYFYDRRLTVALLAISSLIRPEGVLVFFIFILYQIFGEKENLKRCALFLGEYLLLLFPYAVFKYFYYGDLLPNTFYAKAGVSLEHLKSGLEYFFRFLKNYGFLGLGYIIPVYLYKSLDKSLKFLVWVLFGYTFYLILIGGDVLKVHRFFVPVLALIYLFLSLTIKHFYTKLKKKPVLQGVLVSLLILGLGVTFFSPRRWILRVRGEEIKLVQGMEFMGKKLSSDFGPDLTLAVSTIGAISYFSEAEVIDMLGLTDKYIARHPEEVEGIPHFWKEKKYNATYVLSRNPDFIIFSTAQKPSAPAERALYLHSKFRQGYYIFWIPLQKKKFIPVFKKKGQYVKEDQIFDDPEFVNLYSEGLHLMMRGNYQLSIEKLKQVIRVGPPDFAWVYGEIGVNFWNLKDYQNALEYLKKATVIDPLCLQARWYISFIYYEQKKYQEAKKELEQVELYNPELVTPARKILKKAMEEKEKAENL